MPGVSGVAASTTGDGRSAGMRRALLIESDYRGFRIEVTAQHVERVTCRKSSAKVAEERAAVYARRWVDRHRAD